MNFSYGRETENYLVFILQPSTIFVSFWVPLTNHRFVYIMNVILSGVLHLVDGQREIFPVGLLLLS